MIKKFISLFFRQRHYWREVSFDEIAELYMSRLLTVFAQNVVSLFAAVYLFKLGYGLDFIALYYGAIYVIKLPITVLAGKVAAYWGPKHTALVGNLLRIPSLIFFALAAQSHLPAVLLFGLFQGLSIAFYNVGYTVDFSKVHNPLHVGKELGTMQLVEKIARVSSPLIGGVLAAVSSPQVVIVIAIVAFMVSAVPLFRSIEPTKVKSRLTFRGFPWRLATNSLLAQAATGVDFVASGLVWTLFITTVVFGNEGNRIYATIGALASFGVFISMVTSWTFGRLIDRHKAKELIVVGAVGNMIVHAFRPFVAAPAGVVATNITSETATGAYAMSLVRVMFDVADRSGYRILYVVYAEMITNVGCALTCAVWWLTMQWFGVEFAFNAVFIFAAMGVLLLIAACRR